MKQLPIEIINPFMVGAGKAAAMAAFFYVLDGGGWRYGEPLAASAPLYVTATTACFPHADIVERRR